MSLEIGRTYSRSEISEELGGGVRGFLPTHEGRVVCGCFRPDHINPGAPEEILFGKEDESKGIIRAARWVFRQGQVGEDIPVFLKRSTNAWEFVGNYLCIGMTMDPRIVARKRQEFPQRGEFKGVLRFERV